MRPEVIAHFREVADRSPEERDGYYRRENVPDEVRQEIESLLGFDLSSDSLRAPIESAERDLLESPSQVDTHPLAKSRTVPETIGRFAVTRLLGRGGMGEVYLARDPVIDRPVAIKLLGTGMEDEAARRRLVREARTAGRLRHPNIVTIFEAGEFEDRPYIAMEYVPGETLGSIVRRRASISLRRRLELIEGACAGLAYAHRSGVIHLDIKPDNLMLDDDGVVKVLDFGVARVQQGETLDTRHIAGTLRYMSPEQIQEKALDRRSDVFSLGCALFELITYTPAYSGSTNEIVTRITKGPVPRLLDLVPTLDARLGEMVRVAMALDPDKRYQDLDALRLDLGRVRAEIDPAIDEPQSGILFGVVSGANAGSSLSNRGRTSLSWEGAKTHPVAAGVVLALVVGVGALVASGVPWASRQQETVATEATVAPASPAASSALPRETPDGLVQPPARAVTSDRAEGAPPGRSDAPAAGAPVPTPVAPQPAPAQSPAISPSVPQDPSTAAELPRSVSIPEPPPPAAELPAPVVSAPAPVPPPSDSQVILDTLRRYDAAYSARNVSALLQVFPSLGRSQVDQLRRTFDAMTSYAMETRNARVNVSNDTATVQATVARRMTPRVGNPVSNEVETEFQLQRTGAGWTITRVTAR